jgi:hypothetical protein
MSLSLRRPSNPHLLLKSRPKPTLKAFGFERKAPPPHREMLAEIRAAVSAVLPINADAEKLRDASLCFFDHGEFAVSAVLAGWNTVELFGVHCGPKLRERLDAFGLVPALAFSLLGLSIVAVDSEYAVVCTRAGSLLRHPRRRANHDQAMVWWRHAAISHGSEGCPAYS